MNDSLSEAEIQQVASLLAKLEPGLLPFAIFHQITRLTTTAILEIVPLRRNGDKIEILLLPRGVDDPVWPGQLHVPGTVILATDTLDTVFDRLLSKELSGIDVSSPKFVKNIVHHSGRGTEASQIYWVNVTGEPRVGYFYNVDKLPETLVQTQLDFIPAAIDDYRQDTNENVRRS